MAIDLQHRYQMQWEKLIKTFMMISNRKKPFGYHSALKVKLSLAK